MQAPLLRLGSGGWIRTNDLRVVGTKPYYQRFL
jgi:hypothetical protein